MLHCRATDIILHILLCSSHTLTTPACTENMQMCTTDRPSGGSQERTTARPARKPGFPDVPGAPADDPPHSTLSIPRHPSPPPPSGLPRPLATRTSFEHVCLVRDASARALEDPAAGTRGGMHMSGRSGGNGDGTQHDACRAASSRSQVTLCRWFGSRSRGQAREEKHMCGSQGTHTCSDQWSSR